MTSEDSTTNLNGIIARSRSRYKGNRPNRAITSIEAPSRLWPEPLAQHRRGPQYRQEFRKGHADADTYGIGNAPHTPCQRIAGDDYNHTSAPSACDGSTKLPIALPDRHSRDAIGKKPAQVQTIQRDAQRKESFSTTKAEKQSTQSQTEESCRKHSNDGFGEHIVIGKLSSAFTAPREEYRKPTIEHTRPRGGRKADRQGQSNVEPVNSPPMPSKLSMLGEQPMAKLTQTDSHQALIKVSTLQKKSLTHRRKDSNVRDQLKRTISAPMPVEPTEVTIKPAFDAPVSAVNAGERRVRVHLDQTSLSIPVTPSTTPLDILREAGTQLSMSIDATANILLESFKQLGLERPLRRYERVRDVMNSWDNDSQNSLNIVPSPTGGSDDDLDLKSVKRSQPGDTSVHIYHSNAPGSWDKRWINLHTDGQVSMTKKDGKETSNICHVSDFDIYVPTKRQMAKKVKPPKKYCFAVKSQQKLAMFLTTENFVHFFAAGDRELAMTWYKAVQEWRSWYLVNVMGEGQKAIITSSVLQNELQSSMNHQEGTAFYEKGPHQQSAGFVQTQQVSHTFPPKRLTARSHDPPPISFPKKLDKDSKSGIATSRNNAHHRPSIIQHQPVLEAESEPFAAQSLLGRTYTQRKEAVARGDREKAPENGLPAHHIGHRPTFGADGFQQNPSQRQRQRPLLDLTPKHQEPPQHRKKGHGVQPERLPIGGLVEAAANHDPIADYTKLAGADIQGFSSLRTQHPSNRQASASPEKHESAFTGGLLSSALRQTQDSARVDQGPRMLKRTAREPLLNMTTDGPWARGSLLDKVSSADSGSAQNVERAKRQEVDAPVGEGF